MGILDSLFGRSKPVQSKSEKLFAIATAAVSLEAKLELSPAGVAGVVFRPVESSFFHDAETELTQLLELSAKQEQVQVHSETDSFGFRWIVLHDASFENLVATIHMVSLTMTDKGFGDQLLAAVFRVNSQELGDKPAYWIYNYKRGSFYPFVPVGQGQQRDNASELRWASVIDGELPVEKAPEYWYALWGIPF